MEHDCKYSDNILEMSGDVKTLIAKFDNMNGKLVDTKLRYDKHEEESKIFRHKVDTIWTVVHTVKWIIGSSLFIYFVNMYFQK